jgi:hypothetical protein
MMFYNGFNLLVDAVAVMATAFITYRIAFFQGMKAEAQLNPYTSLDEHWATIVTPKSCDGCGDWWQGEGRECHKCVCSDTCGCTLEERGLA